MKHCKIIVSSLLLIALLLAMAVGCTDEGGKTETSSQAQTTSEVSSVTPSEASSEAASSEEASSAPEASGEMAALVGTWETTWDLTEMFNESFAEDEDMGGYIQIESFLLPLTFTFNADGTYSTSVDKEAVQPSMDAAREAVRSGYTKYFEDMLAEEGNGMTVEEYLNSMEMTMDDLLDIAMIGFEFMVEIYDFTADWKAEDGKLYLGDPEEEIDETEYVTYELSGNELKLNELITEDTFSTFSEDMFPMVLTKAA